MTDTELVTQIEACTLPKEAFTHRNHVRLAWLYLRAYPREAAADRAARTISGYAASLGATKKFDAALTREWMDRVSAAMAATPAGDFETFIAGNPDLLSSKRAATT